MVRFENVQRLPAGEVVAEQLAVLDLPISASELHGRMCGYICTDSHAAGETYLQSLITKAAINDATREAAGAMFAIYALSHQQLVNFDFDFHLLLPDDNQPLSDRAEAFSQWCVGFLQMVQGKGMHEAQFEADTVEVLQHLQQFAELNYDASQTQMEEDEKSLMELSEYTRMAVLQLVADFKKIILNDSTATTH